MQCQNSIYHTPGKKNIVPDVLSRAPLPIPTDTMNNFVLPHIKITAFIAANIFSFDISQTVSSENAKLQFDFALFCPHSSSSFTSDPSDEPDNLSTPFVNLHSVSDLNKDSPLKHVDTLIQNNNFTLPRPEFAALQQ